MAVNCSVDKQICSLCKGVVDAFSYHDVVGFKLSNFCYSCIYRLFSCSMVTKPFNLGWNTCHAVSLFHVRQKLIRDTAALRKLNAELFTCAWRSPFLMLGCWYIIWSLMSIWKRVNLRKSICTMLSKLMEGRIGENSSLHWLTWIVTHCNTYKKSNDMLRGRALHEARGVESSGVCPPKCHHSPLASDNKKSKNYWRNRLWLVHWQGSIVFAYFPSVM